MRLLYADIQRKPELEAALVVEYHPLDDLLAVSGYILLLAMENVVLAPHLGGSTFDCDRVLVEEVLRVLVEEVLRVLGGEEPR